MKKITIPIPDEVFQYCWGDNGCAGLVELGMDAENEALTNSPMVRKGRGHSRLVSAGTHVWKLLLVDLDFHGDPLLSTGFQSTPISNLCRCREIAYRVRRRLEGPKERHIPEANGPPAPPGESERQWREMQLLHNPLDLQELRLSSYAPGGALYTPKKKKAKKKEAS